MTRQLSTFDIYTISYELQDLIGSYIDKIYQLSKDEVLIRIRNMQQKKKEYIYIQNEQILCRLQESPPTPIKPSTFAMTLRKHITNARITRIWQHPFDRILHIEVSKKEACFSIILELFKNGNILLVNQEKKILMPLKRQQWSHRMIQIGKPYTPPPTQINPFELKQETFQQILNTSTADLVRTLAAELNFGGLYAEEICSRAAIEKNIKPDSISQENQQHLFQIIQMFLEIFTTKSFNPKIIKKESKPFDITPFPFTIYKNHTSESVDQFVQGLSSFMEIKEESIPLTSTDTKMEKLKRMQVQQQKAILSIKEKITKKNLHGELIYLHFKECEELLQKINEHFNQKDKTRLYEEIKQNSLINNLDMASGIITIELTDLNNQSFQVPLNIRKTVSENAEQSYDESKKQKQKLIGAQQALEKTKQNIISLQHNIDQIKQKKPEKRAKQKQYWFEHYRWFISSNNNIIIGGRDAKTNEQIVKKYLNTGDRYVHADIHGAPSCIIKNKTIDDKQQEIKSPSLEEACIFASSYSKAWNQFVETQAYWVLPEQVSKTPQSGEFVPKGAFIIRGSRNYVKCILELGIGMIEIHQEKKIMCGPVSAIRQHCKSYIIIRPGTIKKSMLVQYVKDTFSVSTEEVQRILPPGDISLISIVGPLKQPSWMKKP